MSGIYGDMLLAFPEQLDAFEAFNMSAKVNGSWKRIAGSEVAIRGIIQHTAGRRVKENGGNLVASSGAELWTAQDGLTGLFMRVAKDTMRISGASQWAREGGFFKYSLEKVIGNDGTQSHDASWNTGSNSFR